MDWGLVGKAAIGLGCQGLVFGAVLAVASKKFYVKTDPRVSEVLSVMPGSNCGACGYPGCEPAAEAIVKGNEPVTLCKAGGSGISERIAEIMGTEAEEGVQLVARLFCRGGFEELVPKAEYMGLNDCRAVEVVSGGAKACEYGCLGLETCAIVCPVNAIEFDGRGLRFVNPRKCTGCGLCVDECPRSLIHLIPRSAKTIVRCSNPDTGKRALSVCKVACIGCKKCEKVCEHDAIHVTDGCAHIDYYKCKASNKCVEVCPTGSIQTWVEDPKERHGGRFIVPPKSKDRSKESDSVKS